MARLFNDALTEYLDIAQPVPTVFPFAMVCLYNTNDLGVHQNLICICDKDAEYERFQLFLHTTGDTVRSIAVSDPGPVQSVAISSISYSANVWQHAAGIFASSTDNRVFLNGGNKGTDNVDVAPENLDTTNIGRFLNAVSGAYYMSGMIAEVAFWDLSVWPGATDSDKADAFEKILPSLAKGFTPDNYPLGLVAYWPLVRGLNDKFGGYNLTAWNLLDEDCSDISDWNDLDQNNGVSEVEPAGQFRMDGNLQHDWNAAQRTRDIGSFPDIFTAEIKVYHDKLGLMGTITQGGTDAFVLSLDRVDVRAFIGFASDGLFVYNGSSWNEVGTNLVKQGGSAEWQIWRFVIDTTTPASATVDIYLTDSTHENVKVGSAIDCSYTGTFTEGLVFVGQYSRITDNNLTHIDYIKIMSGTVVAHPNIISPCGAL